MNTTVVERPTRTKRPGSRSGPKTLVARAMIEQGHSIRTTARISGLSENTIIDLRRSNLVPSSQVEALKKTLRNENALVAVAALNGITDDKLAAASPLACMKIADLAMKNAGLAPPSITESYSHSIQEFVKPADVISTACDAKITSVKTRTILKTEPVNNAPEIVQVIEKQ